MTSCNQNEIMTESDVRKIAQYQELHSVNHSTGYKLSNFITVIVKQRRG